MAGLALVAGPARAQATYPSEPHAPIPNLSPVGVVDSVLVFELIEVLDVDVALTLSHTWTGDLVITLTDPLGHSITLVDRPGVPASTFGCSGDDPDIIADDEGLAGTIENDCQGGTGLAYAIGGRYVPNGPLSDFDGPSMPGYWTLRAADVAGAGDIGTLESWALILEGDILPGTEPAAGTDELGLTVRPNPIGTAGSVVLTLGSSADVRVDLVDTLGRVIGTLHEGTLSAGAHSIPFAAGAPGVYLARAVLAGRAVASTLVVAR